LRVAHARVYTAFTRVPSRATHEADGISRVANADCTGRGDSRLRDC